jgi:hypothetical protein
MAAVAVDGWCQAQQNQHFQRGNVHIAIEILLVSSWRRGCMMGEDTSFPAAVVVEMGKPCCYRWRDGQAILWFRCWYSGCISDYNGPILRLCEQHFFMNEKKHMGYIPFSIAFQQAWQKLTIFSAWTRMYHSTALFAWAYQLNQSIIQQCFSLTTNQRTVLLVMAYQPSEQDVACLLYSHRNN